MGEGKVHKKKKVMLSCEEATLYTSMKLDTKLNLGQRMALAFHLMMCKYCRRFEKEINFISEKIKQFTRREPTSKLKKKLSETKKRDLEELIEKNL